MVELVYFDFGLRVILMIIAFFFFINFKNNLNFAKAKLMRNPVYVRFVTPARREMEFVTSMTEGVYKRKFANKEHAYIVNPKAINFMDTAIKFMGNKKDKSDIKEGNLDYEKCTVREIIDTHGKDLYLKGKMPVITFKTTDAMPVNYYDQKNKLSSEMYADQLVAAEATADIDFFKKLFGYRHVWLIAVGIAIGVGAILVLTFQMNDYINTIEFCKVPGQAAAQAASNVIVAK